MGKNIDNFPIIIASCYEALNIQVPRLIDNIIKCNIPTDYVYIIIGGCPDEKIYSINNIEIIHVKYRCFEFTPFVFIINNPDYFNFDYAFLTHDTVSFGNNFYDIIKNDIIHCRNNNYDTMKIETNIHPSMNIGIYSKNIILKNKDVLNSLPIYSNDHNDVMQLKYKVVSHEDFILNQNNYYNKDNISIIVPTEFKGVNGVISNGLTRNFTRIDFIKYQSNAFKIQSIDICLI